ncbi:MAG: ketoacyl-ACP synthase III [Spirochaetes bacterium]|nr:ketoacyl-ACP synthase III [Spirochaetota bacterium]
MFKVIGTGSYLPEKIMTNQELEKIVDTNDKWIRERTGISERRVASEEQSNSDLAVVAGQRAIENAGLTPKDIDIIIMGTSTPDYTLPACAPIVQHKLGCDLIPAFDVNSVCTSFAYAFFVATGFLTSDYYRNCLVIGSDVYSRILNWQDRTTCCIFGDGAGAFVVQRNSDRKGLLAYQFGSIGEDADLIRIPVGGSKYPTHAEMQYEKEDYFFQMAGLDVYEFTITRIPKAVGEILDDAKLTRDDIDWIVLHQANRRIIESVAKKTKIPLDKFIVNIEKVGNMSSASIPVAVDHARSAGKIKPGDKIMMVGFGGGLSWGGVLFEW